MARSLAALAALACSASVVEAKREQSEGDDSAMLFFLLAILSCVLVPWTLVVVWGLLFPGSKEVATAFPEVTESGSRVHHCHTQAMEARRDAEVKRLRSRRLTAGFVARLVLLGLLWCWLIYIISQVRNVLATSALYQNFDPYAILEVSSRSGKADIKKAFRKMSLTYHPDKNSAAGAAERFMLIKKAYDALSDPVAMRNYQNYGNPDGPTRIEISVALPSVSKQNQGLVLVLFLVLFIIGVPLMMLWCMTGSSVDANGLSRSANEALDAAISPSLDMRGVQELVLRACAAGDGSSTGARDEAVSALREQLRGAGASFSASSGVRGAGAGGKKGAKAAAAGTEGEPDDASAVALRRAEVLFWAHVLRRTDLLAATPLAAELELLLPRWRAACRVIMQRAMKKGMEDALLAAVEVHRCLVQAIEPSAASKGGPGLLLQLPHFTAERAKLWRKGPRKNALLPEFLALPADERAASLAGEGLGFEAQELADIDEFCVVAPRLQLQKARVVVVGEDEICQGDMATLELRLLRANVREGEVAGNAHTPHFPGAQVAEAWWVTFRLPGRGRTAASVCSRIVDPSREVVATVKFRVPVAGKCRLRLSLSCEGYAGLDQEHEVSYVAKQAAASADESDGSEEDFEDE